ncbi:MAG: hypothetical protein U5K27_16970 [Desulfotignum sp.]|nr:hypothetical protein [Desulfotignum sp.]
MQDDVKKAIFIAKKMFAQLIYDFQSLEAMPFTFPEVTTFLQGITVGGHKISDQDKLRQQQLGWQRLIELVEQERFTLSEKTACELEGIVAKQEALIPGVLRNGAVSVSSGDFTFHPPDAHELPTILAKSFENAKDASVLICDRGYRLALDFAYNQFHWEGNKRTGTLMMNGLFLSNGILPCSVPAGRLQEYNTLLMKLYKTGEYGSLIDFYKDCHQTIYADWQTAFPE